MARLQLRAKRTVCSHPIALFLRLRVWCRLCFCFLFGRPDLQRRSIANPSMAMLQQHIFPFCPCPCVWLYVLFFSIGAFGTHVKDCADNPRVPWAHQLHAPDKSRPFGGQYQCQLRIRNPERRTPGPFVAIRLLQFLAALGS